MDVMVLRFEVERTAGGRYVARCAELRTEVTAASFDELQQKLRDLAASVVGPDDRTRVILRQTPPPPRPRTTPQA